MKEIKYLGHIIDEEGRRPDPERATAIIKMPAPKNLAELQSFLGLVNYYQEFIPNMHKLRAPLNELLQKEKVLEWSYEYQKMFDKIIKTLTADIFLVHYDPKLKIIFASTYGVGACILHKMPDGTLKPIAHASRTLLPAEQNYSQIENEVLGIIFAVTRFHRYIYGRFSPYRWTTSCY